MNSVGGFLGLYNTTTISEGSRNQIVHVEFDTFPNPELQDPTYEHVGINNNSITSSVNVPWNVTHHSGDKIDAWVTYNGSTKKLSVHWSFQTTTNPNETTNLSMPIDLSKVLPEWVKIGFSAATGAYKEQHSLLSWDFTSSLSGEGSSSGTTTETKILLGVTIPAGVLIIALATVIGVAWRRRKNKQKGKNSMQKTALATSINDDLERGAGPRRFSYKDLATATSNFSNDRKLGEGGFGAVFRGYLPDLDLVIAVKKISQGSRQGRKEYITEVKVISSLRHRNLVRLIGWCHDEGQFLLIYEYMPNGSLDAHLFGKRVPLVWSNRYKISLGLASALLYLHEEWEQCVVHRDIKSSNVMLDSIFNAKLGDFGLAKLMDHDLGPQTTGLAGTLGYLAPEYIATGRASKESDVYSFGMVLLEIGSGRRVVDPIDKNSYMSLLEWIWGLYGSNNLLRAVDERMNTTDYDMKQVECLMSVGLWCAHPDRNLRPSMGEAIQALTFNAEIPLLPTKMPVATYHIPTPPVSSGDPLISSIIEEGR